jgi:hypothetical protein
VLTEITGILGVYSDPGHIVAYTDGEIRQEWELILVGRPVSGAPAVNDEASDVRWVMVAPRCCCFCSWVSCLPATSG